MSDRAPAAARLDRADSGSLGVRADDALRAVLARATSISSPPRLRDALTYAVFPGGARLRPRLCLGVAAAYGQRPSDRAAAAAAAVELVHCASLVHDDMPCFDDAELRRGRPTVHKVYGEATAVLVGDALIVLAFDTLARAAAIQELGILAEAVGPARGVIAGQAWESELAIPLDEYHRAKTAALFEAAAAMGAIAAEVDVEPWRAFGERIGRAYQAADDLADAVACSASLGKCTGRDAALARPSLVRALGVENARARVAELVAAARDAIPRCPGADSLQSWVDALSARVGLA